MVERAVPKSLLAKIEKQIGPLDAALKAVAGQVWQASSPEAFYDAERAVRDAFVERADIVVGMLLASRVKAASLVEPAKSELMSRAVDAGGKLKSHGRRSTPVRLLGGSVVSVSTLALLPVSKPATSNRAPKRRGKTGSGVFPALFALGITSQATPALRAQVAREVADADSVSVARASLVERGLDIEHKTALRLTYSFAEQALERRGAESAAALKAEAEGPLELDGKHVAVAIDGGRLRVRENPKAGRRRANGHRRYDAPWREPKVLTVYVVDEDGKKDPAHRAFLDGTMGNCEEAFALLVGRLRVMGAHRAARVTLLGDGAEWIWGRADALREALGLRREQFHEIVDYFHAVENVTKIADCVTDWTDAARLAWMKRAKALLNAGEIEVLVAHADELAMGTKADQVESATDYFVNHAARMRYQHFRKAGLPIGSGAIESGIRRVVNQRLKGSSIYWLEEHAEALLHLRAQLKTGRWDEFVRATLAHPTWSPRSQSTS